jgi:hypothetical protein
VSTQRTRQELEDRMAELEALMDCVTKRSAAYACWLREWEELETERHERWPLACGAHGEGGC